MPLATDRSFIRFRIEPSSRVLSIAEEPLKRTLSIHSLKTNFPMSESMARCSAG